MNYFENNPELEFWFKAKRKLYEDAIKKDIMNNTCQFFYNDYDKQRTVATGSGVFIDYKGDKYLITAAHVLEDNHESTFLLIDGNEFILGGVLFYSELPQNCKDRSEDLFDIAFIRLDGKTIDYLQKNNFTFVEQKRLDINHKVDEYSIYLTYGYPVSMTDTKYSSKIEALALETSVCVKDSIFKKYNINTKTNTLAIYPKKGHFNISNPYLHQGVKPVGMSGSGFWNVASMKPNQNETIPTKLVSILTTWKPKDNIMVATNISDILLFIDSKI